VFGEILHGKMTKIANNRNYKELNYTDPKIFALVKGLPEIDISIND